MRNDSRGEDNTAPLMQNHNQEMQVAYATCIRCHIKVPLQKLVLGDGGFQCKDREACEDALIVN